MSDRHIAGRLQQLLETGDVLANYAKRLADNTHLARFERHELAMLSSEWDRLKRCNDPEKP